MNTFKVPVIAVLIVTIIVGCTSGSDISVKLEETTEAFQNPLKGFRPSRYIQADYFMEHEYASIYKHYIKYTDLENKADDSVQKIVDWCNQAWAGIEDKNIKVIPRVVIVYPNGPDNGSEVYWPEGVPHGDPVEQWLSEELKIRLTSFIQKLGKAWDNDPRVAAVEAGLRGKWGEHHIYPVTLPSGGDRIPPEFQKVLGDAYSKAFKNKKVMVRYPETFTDYDFGYFWDSFALPNDMAGGEGIIERDVWRTQMISGEVAYNWGDQSKLGGSPNGTLNSDSNTEYVIDWIYKTHNSSLGCLAEYKAENQTILENAARMQKAFGYRYIIKEATFRSNVRQTFRVSFEVENIGAAPMYYNWPVECSLLNTDRELVWKSTFDTDVTQWMPGTTNPVTGKFDVSGISDGTYILAIAVLDPAGNNPSLRFANSNYYTGGRTPIGKIGIGQEAEDQDLLPFDSLKEDNSLFYIIEKELDRTKSIRK